MSPTTSAPRYLMRWNFHHAAGLGERRIDQDPVSTTHRLGEISIFNDQGLANLIDCYPVDAISLESACIRGNNGLPNQNSLHPSYPSRRYTGNTGSAGGDEILSLIRQGCFSIVLRDVDKHSPALQSVLNRLQQEMTECSKSLRMHRFSGDLHVTSPESESYLRCDTDPIVRWQVRGNNQITTYPMDTIDDGDLADRLLQNDRDVAYRRPLYHEPAMEEHRQSINLPSGSMQSILQRTPHRVIQGDSLGVTLLTRYQTDDSRRCDNTLLANQWIHKQSDCLLSNQLSGISGYCKRWIATLIRRRLLSSPAVMCGQWHDNRDAFPYEENIDARLKSWQLSSVEQGKTPTIVPSIPCGIAAVATAKPSLS